ncbi:MAG: C25 family cysteine peptidase [Wenzhouxiangella sp.]|nr:C25 family cysteine peptidase [Wenzhouxiangella sp.]
MRRPDRSQGFGRVNLEDSLIFDGGRALYFHEHAGLNTADTFTTTITTQAGGAPFRASLVWTDFQGTEASNGALVNDLDLEVLAPGGVLHRGNELHTSGAADRDNNVEVVELASASGTYEITVRGFNVPQGPQPFALVISYEQAVSFVLQSGEDTVSACGGVDATVNIDALSFSGFNDVVSFSTSGLPAGASASFSPSSLVPDDPAVSSVLTLSDTGLVSPGAYPFTMVGDSSGPNFPAESVSLPLTLQVSSGLPAAPVLLAPANGAILASPTPTLQWGAVSGALEYLVEVSDSTSFSSPVYSASVTGTSHAVGSALPIDEPLYWRVSAINACGAGSVSVMASFTISGPVCRSPALAIPDGVPAGINDSLTLTGAGNLADMQVYLRASHTWVGDLVFTLTSPSGTAVTLINRPGVDAGSTFGCGNNDIDVTLNDAASNSVQTACSPTPPAIGGVLTPAQPLSVLAGEPMAGEWTLNVADFVTPDPGVLEEWCLIPADAAQPIIELEPDSVAVAVGVDLTKTVPVAVGNVGTAALDWQFTATGLFGEIGLRRVQGEASRPDIPAFGTIDSIGLSLAEPGSGPERSVPYAAASPRSGLSLTHSNSQTVTAALTPACGSAGFTSQNAYLRTFTLTDFGINDAFAVEAVTFGVEQSTASSTPITVNLYSLVGAFQYANMTLIGSSIQNLPSQSLTLVTVPISGQVPAGGTLVVEVLAPDQSGVAAFRAGANSDGETAPSYIAAPGCGINEPTAMASIGFPDTHLVMTVSGRLPLACTAPDDIAWLALAPGSGTAAAGSQQTVTLILDASGLSPGAYTDQLCVQSNDPVNPLLALPVEMTVVDTYAVGGTVSGLAGSGLVLQNNGADDLSVTADGVFNFVTPVADGASYAVSVLGQPAGQVCTVSNGTGTIAGAAVSDVGVSCVTATGDQALQVGSVNMAAIAGSGLRASAGPMSVSFPVVFSEPPVVIVMPGNEGVEARSVRIRNVTSSGFELLPVTAPPGDGDGPPMTVHYIAAVPGDYPLPIVGGGTGPRVQVGRWDTTTIQYNPEAFPPNVLPEDNSGNPGSACSQAPTPGWDGQSFPGTDFATPPVLLASVQSWNNEGVNLNGELEGPSAPFMNVALQNIGISGFDGAIELSEVRRNVPCAGLVGAETIGYVAIEDNVDVLLEPSGGGSPITLVTGIGIAHRGEANDPPTWSASHCRDNDLSVTGSFVEANLRGFAALRSRAEADGGWLRRCSVSSPSSGTLRLALRIDEDTHFDAERRQPPAPTTTGEIRDEPVSMAVFGGDFVTTPVSLAWMKVEPLSASRVRVDWATETEVGHVGFELQARGRDGRWQPVGEMIPGRGFGELGGDDYSIELALPSSAIELRLVDVDQFGQRRLHAPVAIGSEQGARSQIELTDWAAINARNAQFPITARQASGGTMAVARVFEAGIQRLTHSELLAAGVDLSGQTAALVAVWSGGVPQARYVGGPEVWAEDSYVEWLGEVSDSRYHATRAYRIGVDAAAAVAVPTGQPALAGSGPRIERHALRFERNRRYSPTSPAEDPWFDARLSTAGNPVQIQREFELGPRAPGSALLEVDVWGGLDYPGETPDHHVELWLNGQRIASHRFDGLVAERIVVELEDQWLAENNELIIRLPGDTGYPADVVQFDGFTVTLPRQSAFHDGRGQGADAVSGQGDRVFHSRFETSQTGFLIDQAPTGAVVWYESPDLGLVRLVHDEGALWLSEDVSAWTGTGPGHFVQPQVEMAVAAAEPEGADYLIISHPQFVEHLQPLIALQLARGLSVAVARTDEIYAAFGHDEPIPEAIAAFVAAQATARYVLLVGGDHVDYRGYLGNEAVSFIPTFYRQADAIVRHAPDELEFVDRNGDGLPDAALGRLPVRSVEELQRLLTAIVELDQAGPAERLLIASGGSGGAHERCGHDARVLGSISADISSLSYAAVDELGTESARQRVRDALAGEADWLSYLGHSAPDRWGFEPLLLRSQLASIVREAPPAIISQWGCWNNWFVSPTQNSMIHGLMLGDQVKAATVLGSVSLAEDASHFALAVRFYSLRASGGLHGQPGAVNTLGEALLHAKRDLVQNAPGHQSAARSVVLFGDPAQPLR